MTDKNLVVFMTKDRNYIYVHYSNWLQVYRLMRYGYSHINERRHLVNVFYMMLLLGKFRVKDDELESVKNSVVGLYMQGKLNNDRVKAFADFVEDTIIFDLSRINRESFYTELLGYISDAKMNNIMLDEIRSYLGKVYKDFEVEIDYSLFRDRDFRFYEHQIDAIKAYYRHLAVYNSRSFGFFMEPRLGKTYCALYCTLKESLANNYKVNLVVCPKRIMEPVWAYHLEQFNNVDYAILGDEFTIEERLAYLQALCMSYNESGKVLYVITNYDTFSRLNPDIVDKLNLDFGYLILDESHKVKDRATKAHKVLKKINKKCRNCILMTGTPFGNKYTEVYNQMEFVDAYPFNCDSLSQFSYRFITVRNYMEVLTNPSDFYGYLREKSFMLKSDLVLKLPEYIYYGVEMTPSHYELYREVMEGEVKRLRDVFEYKNILQAINKALQVSSGFLYYNIPNEDVDKLDRDVVNIAERYGTEIAKLELLYEMIEEYVNGSPIIVVAVYKYMYNLLADYCSRKGYSYAMLTGGTDNVSEIIERFNNGELQVLIVNPKVGGMGLDLSSANVILYPTYNFSLIEMRQMRDRIVRPDKKVPTTVVFLYHKASIDEYLISKVRTKSENLDKILSVGSLERILFGESV